MFESYGVLILGCFISETFCEDCLKVSTNGKDSSTKNSHEIIGINIIVQESKNWDILTQRDKPFISLMAINICAAVTPKVTNISRYVYIWILQKFVIIIVLRFLFGSTNEVSTKFFVPDSSLVGHIVISCSNIHSHSANIKLPVQHEFQDIFYTTSRKEVIWLMRFFFLEVCSPISPRSFKIFASGDCYFTK